MTNKKGHDIPLVKLNAQTTSFPAVWNIKCLRQHEHIIKCCPELHSVMCHHDLKNAAFYSDYTIHQLMF